MNSEQTMPYSHITRPKSQLQGCSLLGPVSHADPNEQVPGSSGLGLHPVSAHLGAKHQGHATHGTWAGGQIETQVLDSSAGATNQGLATSTQCAPAAGGPGRGWCWWTTWPPPAAPGAVALSDAELGTWKETQPRGLTDTGGNREGKAEGESVQMPGPGDPWLPD